LSFQSRPYTVHLRGYPGIPRRDRLIAEVRFAASLEFLFGGSDAVLAAFQMFCSAVVEAGPPGESEGLARWEAGVHACRATALRGMPVPASAFFEIMTSDKPAGRKAEGLRKRTRNTFSSPQPVQP
jgi:hypothetical protein